MPQVNIFRWRPGAGWLVLSGGGDVTSDDVQSVEARLLNRTLSQGPIAYIWAASDPDTADRHMDALRELGARTGFLVDVLTESDADLLTQLSEAGVIILGDGPRTQVLLDALAGPVTVGLETAYSRGATIYAVGRSAGLLGAYFAADKQLMAGLGWLQQAVVQANFTTEQAVALRQQVAQLPNTFGVGLSQGAALALGPAGEVETWGNAAVTVALGQDYNTPSNGNSGEVGA